MAIYIYSTKIELLKNIKEKNIKQYYVLNLQVINVIII